MMFQKKDKFTMILIHYAKIQKILKCLLIYEKNKFNRNFENLLIE